MSQPLAGAAGVMLCLLGSTSLLYGAYCTVLGSAVNPCLLGVCSRAAVAAMAMLRMAAEAAVCRCLALCSASGVL